MRERGRDHLERALVKSPAFGEGNARVQVSIKAVGNLFHRYIAHTIGIVVTSGDKALIQTGRQLPQVAFVISIRIVIRLADGIIRVFKNHPNVQTVILAHGKAGQIPVVIIGVNDARGGFDPVGQPIAIGFGRIFTQILRDRTGIRLGQQQPHQPRLLERTGRADTRSVEHPCRKRHLGAILILHNNERRIRQQYFTRLILGAHRDAEHIHLCRIKPGCDRRGVGNGRRAGFDRQISILPVVIRNLQFKHRNQAQIAVGLLSARAKGGRVDTLHLPFTIIRRPVQYVERVPQMLRVDRAQLKIHVGRLVNRKLVEREFKHLVLQARDNGAAIFLLDFTHHQSGSRVQLIRDIVVVIVEVEDVGRSIQVGVRAS